MQMTKRIFVSTLVCAVLFYVVSLLASPVDDSKDVTTAGIAEPLSATATKCVHLTVIAKLLNTNNIFVGASTIADGRGIELDAGDSYTFQAVDRDYTYNLTEIYVDAETSGEGVTYLCEAKD